MSSEVSKEETAPVLAESSSFAEITAETSSPAETAIGEPASEHIASKSWLLHNGASETTESVKSFHEIGTGFDMAVSAHSDTHPDVACNLIAEYLADTISRIDSGAVVDLSVTMKQDLVVVTGEVGCSHPAKSAIIHSDQFLQTLNGSIREIFRDLGFDSGQPAPVSTLQPALQSSPMKKGVQASPAPVSGSAAPSDEQTANNEDEANIDPSLIHIIIAISDSVRASRSSGVVCRAKACENDLGIVARKICNNVTDFLKEKKASLVGGVTVDLLPSSEGKVDKVSVSFYAPAMTAELAKEMSDSCISKDFLKSLSNHIHDDTVVEIKHSGRNRTTGRSCEFTGKSWDDPRRYGAVLSRQTARHLVKSGICSMCEIEIRLHDSVGIDHEVRIMNLNVNSFGSSKEQDAILIQKAINRCANRSLKEIQESVMGETNSTLFALRQGGSRCLDDSLLDNF